jgi:hypothetical protein
MSEWHSVHTVMLMIKVCTLVGSLYETLVPPCLFRTEFDVKKNIHFVVEWEIHQHAKRCTGLNWQH